MARKSGELWISKSTPHTLKYYAGSTEYWSVSATTYIAGEPIVKGNILAVNKDSAITEGTVKKAVFPDDINNVIGVALNDAPLTFQVRVLNYGYLELNRAELENLFITKSDLTLGPILADGVYYSPFGNTTADAGGGNGWSTTAGIYSGNGAPVYWYQGRIIKTGASTYAMQQPTSKAGILTLGTPSGYKYPDPDLLAWGDASFNLDYKYLPVIGNIYEYEVSGTDITKMIIHVNFSKFNRKLQFNYPATGLREYDPVSVNDLEDIIIRHGLFTESTILPYTEVSILGSIDSSIDGPIVRVWPGYSSVKASSQTTVTIASDSAFHGKIIGEVSYIL